MQALWGRALAEARWPLALALYTPKWPSGEASVISRALYRSAAVPLAGQSATFTVTATGDNLRYQWQVNGTDLPAATSETYTIDPVAVGDTGDYQCVVSNTVTNESVTSAAASLTVGKCVSA